MSVRTPAPRPTRGAATEPVGAVGPALAAALTSLLVLLALVVVVLAFVLAPLALLGVGALALLAARAGGRR